MRIHHRGTAVICRVPFLFDRLGTRQHGNGEVVECRRLRRTGRKRHREHVEPLLQTCGIEAVRAHVVLHGLRSDAFQGVPPQHVGSAPTYCVLAQLLKPPANVLHFSNSSATASTSWRVSGSKESPMRWIGRPDARYGAA